MVALWNIQLRIGFLVLNIMTIEKKSRLSSLYSKQVAVFIESSLPTTGRMEIVECKNLEKSTYTREAFSHKAFRFFYILIMYGYCVTMR